MKESGAGLVPFSDPGISADCNNRSGFRCNRLSADFQNLSLLTSANDKHRSDQEQPQQAGVVARFRSGDGEVHRP